VGLREDKLRPRLMLSSDEQQKAQLSLEQPTVLVVSDFQGNLRSIIFI